MTVPTTAVSGTPSRAPGRLLDELAGLLLPVVMPLVRRLPAMILVLAALISLMGILVLVGAHRDDAEIQAHLVTATAEVLPGSDLGRTLISFTTANGETVSPERGVFYPRGLQPGQIVRVEYDSTHPERVRVAGRNASVGSLPIGLLLLVTWAIALPVGFSLRGRQLRRIEATRLAAAEAAVAARLGDHGQGMAAVDPEPAGADAAAATTAQAATAVALAAATTAQAATAVGPDPVTGEPQVLG